MSTASRRSKGEPERETNSRRSRAAILATTSSERPTEAVKVESVPKTREERSVKEFLREKGYSFIRGIYLGEEGHGVLTYVKATVLGLKVYIDLDMTYTDIKADENDLGVMRASLPNGPTLSNNEKAERCASMDVCGTVWECKNGGFCMERRNEKTLDLEEDAFHIAEGSAVFEKDDALSYPIVRISDIIKDNLATVQNIINASKRNAAKAKKKFLDRKLILKTAVEELYLTAKSIDITLEKALDALDITIRHQDQINGDIEFPPSFHQRAQFDQQMSDTEKLHDRRETLIASTGLFDGYIELIREMEDELLKMELDVARVHLGESTRR